MKHIVGVEEAPYIPNGNSFMNAMAFTLAFPLPKTLNWCIMFTVMGYKAGHPN
jgi:hypothetical protein